MNPTNNHHFPAVFPTLGPEKRLAGRGRPRLSGALQLQCPVRAAGHAAAERGRGPGAPGEMGCDGWR